MMGLEVDDMDRANLYDDGIILERATNWVRRPFCMLPCVVEFFVRERMSLQCLADKPFRRSLIHVLFLVFGFFVGLHTAVSFI
jgi:hypothetical protein